MPTEKNIPYIATDYTGQNQGIPLNTRGFSSCALITAYWEGEPRDFIQIKPNQLIISVDKGYEIARSAGIIPHLLIGDFDSLLSPLPDNMAVIRLPAEKDDTDTLSALKYAMEQGFKQIDIYGGLGGRIDHSLANIQLLAYALDRGVSVKILDAQNMVLLMQKGMTEIRKIEGYKLSLLAFSDICTGVSVSGVKYPLSDRILTNTLPLGVSNEFMPQSEKAVITLESGKLLVILSKDKE